MCHWFKNCAGWQGWQMWWWWEKKKKPGCFICYKPHVFHSCTRPDISGHYVFAVVNCGGSWSEGVGYWNFPLTPDKNPELFELNCDRWNQLEGQAKNGRHLWKSAFHDLMTTEGGPEHRCLTFSSFLTNTVYTHIYIQIYWHKQIHYKHICVYLTYMFTYICQSVRFSNQIHQL